MTLRERLAASVTDIRTRGQRLVQLNLELLTSELREKGRQFGAAVGLFIGAGLLALYAVGFALATITALLALVLPWWAALLIVTAVLVLIVLILALVGRSKLQQAKTPAPEAALAEARVTADLMKANLRETATGVRAKMAPARRTPDAGTAPPAPAPTLGSPASGDQPPAPPSDLGAKDS
jgi:MFS family permease